jgi:hypothetical protein
MRWRPSVLTLVCAGLIVWLVARSCSPAPIEPRPFTSADWMQARREYDRDAVFGMAETLRSSGNLIGRQEAEIVSLLGPANEVEPRGRSGWLLGSAPSFLDHDTVGRYLIVEWTPDRRAHRVRVGRLAD